LRPGIAVRKPALRRTDRIITHFGMAIRMRIDAATKVSRQHLGAEANAKEGLALVQRHRDPINLAAHELIFIIRAHRAAEDDRTRMLGHARGQLITVTRPTNVEREAAFHKSMPDPAGRGALLMQHNKNRQSHGVRIRWHAGDALKISRAWAPWQARVRAAAMTPAQGFNRYGQCCGGVNALGRDPTGPRAR